METSLALSPSDDFNVDPLAPSAGRHVNAQLNKIATDHTTGKMLLSSPNHSPCL
jgi:hypothetical protein